MSGYTGHVPLRGDAIGESAQLAGRRSPISLDELFDVFTRDAVCHMAGPPAAELDLKQLERVIGRPLPRSFRAFLARFGGGLFYQGHEIFGPHRVMIHDIELVPSLGSVYALLHPPEIPEAVFPFHRKGDVFHLLDMRDPAQPERIVSRPYGATYPDFARFLQAVVVPPVS